MRNVKLAPWVLAAVTAIFFVGAASVQAVSNSPGVVKLLKMQLSPGVTLAKATIPQTVSALNAAVTQRPDLAVVLTEAAVLAKTPKQGQGILPCEALYKIVGGAISAAPDKSSVITQMALSLHPECADSFDSVLNLPIYEFGGFGVGFGANFPGSPGFTGSPPSGAGALPPTVVTSVLNG